jgi:hypothetical protein
MNRIRRLAALLAGLAGALQAAAAAAPAALARPFPPHPPGWDQHPPLPPPGAGIHVVVAGGMPGWQIAVIAAAAGRRAGGDRRPGTGHAATPDGRRRLIHGHGAAGTRCPWRAAP